MAKLVISIVTWNSAESIEACIASVLAQTFTEYDLFVLDNASTDDTRLVIEKLNNGKIKFIRSKKNSGFCEGHNQVINSTKSEFVLLVNPDIILQPDYVEKALDTMMEKNNTGTVCGLLAQSNDQNAVIDSAGLMRLPSGIMSLIDHGKRTNEVELKKKEVFGADGALPLYRRAMIDHVSINGNFFDELFFAHKEDWDVSWRSSIYGWKTIFDPNCKAVHPRVFKPGNRKVRKTMSDQIKIDAVKNQMILLKKNLSTTEFFANFFTIVPRQLGIFFYILLFERSSLKAYSIYSKHKAEIEQARKIIQSNRNTAPNS
ncbi:MAG: glycosyltransferase family 2 protein [Bacteroidota bacterium]|mgnify:CR=1 FL=1|nr:glycosyltransferase family 2 protein [Bacteroidota bacterium]